MLLVVKVNKDLVTLFSGYLQVNQLDNLASHSLNLLDGVDAVVGPDRDSIRHLFLPLRLLVVLVTLLLNLWD